MLRKLTATVAIALACAMALPIAALPVVAQPAGARERLNMAWPVNVGPLNPHLYTPNQMFAQSMVYEPLVKYGKDGVILPWLATSWEVSEDGRTYVFHLRPDVIFSNGEPFNAQAVVANFNAVLENRERHAWLELANQIQSVEEIDPLTVRMILKDPYYPVLQELALPRPFRFIAPSQFQEGGTMQGIKAPIGTGPWKLVETRLGEQDRFARNDAYWGEKPVIEEVVIKVVPDPNTRAIAFETGGVDLLYGSEGPVSPDTFERFRHMPNVSTALSAPMETHVLALNSQKGPTRDVAVRKAINHAVDKDKMIAKVLYNTQQRADALFAPNVPYADLGLKPYAHDPDLARKLLDDAGWTLEPGAKVRSRNGEPLEIELSFIGNDALAKSMSEIMQADLAKVGISIRLVGEEESSVYSRQRDGRFGMIFNRTWGAPYDPHAFMSSMRAPSHADYQAQLGLSDKAEIDARISRALVTTDEGERRALYAQILTRLHDAAIYLPLTYVPSIAVSRPDLGPVPFGAMASEIPFEQMDRKAD